MKLIARPWPVQRPKRRSSERWRTSATTRTPPARKSRCRTRELRRGRASARLSWRPRNSDISGEASDRIKEGTADMEPRFHKDPDTGLPHIYDHGVTEDEVRQVLARPQENRSEDSFAAIGQTSGGR